MWTYPKGHGPTFQFDTKELERLIKANCLRLFCGMYGDFYDPDLQAKQRLLRHIEAEHASRGREANST